MSELKIRGLVRSYAVGDDGKVHLGIDDSEPSREAEFYVHDMQKSFNPGNPKFGYGAKDTPCNVKPGFASYRVAVEPGEANGIAHGCYVDLVLDVFNVRKVRFYNKRWTGIPELNYELVSIRPVGDSRQDNRPSAGEQRQDNKSEKANAGNK